MRRVGECLLLWLIPIMAVAKRPAPVIAYENTKAFHSSCADVWAVVPSIVAKRGFMPDSSDRAGGFMKLRWTKGDSVGYIAGKDVKQLTLERGGAITTYGRLRVVGASLSLTDSAGSCKAILQVEYNALKSSIAQTGWIAVQSNGFLETLILAEIDAAIKK